MKSTCMAAALVAATLLATPAAAATWTAYNYGPSDSMANVQNFRKILNAIEEVSEGEIKFRVRLGGSLPIQASNITQAVGNGTIQFADDGFFLGNVTIPGILRLPMLLHTPEEYETAVKVLEPYMNKEFEEQGVIVLGRYLYAHQSFYSAKKIESTADISGQKIRVTSPEQADIVQRYNGVPVTMGTPEVAPALQSGAVDGALTASAGGGKLWQDMFKYNYRLPVNYFDGLYVVNKKAFEALDPALQEKIRKTVAELAPTTTHRLLSEEDDLTEGFRKNGMVVTLPDQKTIDKAIEIVTPFWDQWAKERGPVAVEALAKVRAALNR